MPSTFFVFLSLVFFMLPACTPRLISVPISLTVDQTGFLNAEPSASAFQVLGTTGTWQFQKNLNQNIISKPQQVEFSSGAVRLIPRVTEDLVGTSFSGTGQRGGSLSPDWTPHYDQLIGYWPMDSVSAGGTILPGFSLNGASLPGEIFQSASNQPGQGGSQLVSGVVHSAFQFDGATGIYIPLPSSSLQNPIQGPSNPDIGFTVSFWFKMNQGSQPLFAVVSSKNAPDGYADRMIHSMNSRSICFKNIGPGFFPWNVDNQYQVPNIKREDCSQSLWVDGSELNYADGQWHHVLATYQKDVAVPHLYLDGSPVFLYNFSNDISAQITSTTALGHVMQPQLSYSLPPFEPGGIQLGFVAAGNYVRYPYPNFNFFGSIDELALFSGVFSPLDVKTLYSRQKHQRFQGSWTSSILDAGFLTPLWNALKWVTSAPFGKGIASQPEEGYQENPPSFSDSLVAHWTFEEGYDLDSNPLKVTNWNVQEIVQHPLAFLDRSNRGHTLSFTVQTIAFDMWYAWEDPITNASISGDFYFFPKFQTAVQAPFGKPVLSLLSGHETELSTPDHEDFQWSGVSWSVAGWFYLPTVSVASTSINNDFPNTNNLAAYPLLYKLHGTIPAPLYWEVRPDFRLRAVLGNGQQAQEALDSGPVVPSDQWVHLALSYDHTYSQVTHYVNGKASPPISLQLLPGSFGTEPLYVAGKNRINDHSQQKDFTGMIREVAIWKGRSLSSSDVLELYHRGAHTLKIQVRSCAQPDCSDGTFQGPDGTAFSSFSEDVSSSPHTVPSVSLPSSGMGSLPSQQYVQYKASFDSASNQDLPSLSSVHFGPTHYDNTHPWVLVQTGASFSNLSQFLEVPGTESTQGCSTYQLSPNNGTNWYYWDKGLWKISSTAHHLESNTAGQVNAALNDWKSQVGSGGTLGIRLFLNSDGTHPCAVEKVILTGTFE